MLSQQLRLVPDILQVQLNMWRRGGRRHGRLWTHRLQLLLGQQTVFFEILVRSIGYVVWTLRVAYVVDRTQWLWIRGLRRRPQAHILHQLIHWLAQVFQRQLVHHHALLGVGLGQLRDPLRLRRIGPVARRLGDRRMWSRRRKLRNHSCLWRRQWFLLLCYVILHNGRQASTC